MSHIISFIKHFFVLWLVIIASFFYIFLNSYNILVDIRDIESKYYVIDGWMDDNELRKAYELIKDRDYDRIYTLGLYNGYNSRFHSTNYGDFARNRLLHNYPIEPDKIKALHFNTKTNRTYTGVKKLKEELLKEGITTIVLVTLDVHTAKSMHIYDAVFKDSGIKVGALGAKILNEDDWYKNSYDFMKVTSELLSLLLTKLKY